MPPKRTEQAEGAGHRHTPYSRRSRGASQEAKQSTSPEVKEEDNDEQRRPQEPQEPQKPPADDSEDSDDMSARIPRDYYYNRRLGDAENREREGEVVHPSIEEPTSPFSALRAQRDEYQATIDRYLDDVVEAENRQRAAEQQLAEQNEEIDNMTRDMHNVVAERDHLRGRIAEWRIAHNKLNRERNDAEEGQRAAARLLDVRNDSIIQLTRERNTAEQRYNRLVEQHNRQVGPLNDEIAVLRRRNEQQRRQLAHNDRQLQEQAQEIAELRVRLAAPPPPPPPRRQPQAAPQHERARSFDSLYDDSRQGSPAPTRARAPTPPPPPPAAAPLVGQPRQRRELLGLRRNPPRACKGTV
ncbi:MAG: hypothetical protein L6R39_004419 [Caloplaca ligustica]|nr:MAG: hypothetical protein L6R39_004419 [Caloplaca ligustica]